jgi:glycosyltransferase involved in cell wall biosynthesis
VAQERLGPLAPVEHIPNGVDTAVFRPAQDRLAVRRLLNLPLDRNVVLFGANSAFEPRKGATYLAESLALLRERRGRTFEIVVFGFCKEATGMPADWVHVGEIRDERLLALYYAAADVYVLPSLADNLPCMLTESIACGTPCVTFDVGGCPEIVRNGQTGFVARLRDVRDLADCIDRVLALPAAESERLRKRCREVAEKEYSLSLQAERYAALFNAHLRAEQG